MPARVVLHAQMLDPFLLGVKTALGKRGVTVVHENSFDAGDLHFCTNRDNGGENVVQIMPLPIAPYRALVHPTLSKPFDPGAVSYSAAKKFLEDLRADYAIGKRYAAADLPDGMLAVCIAADDDDPAHIDVTHQMIADALATKRDVVLVADDPMNSGRLAQYTAYFPSVLVYHDLLADVLHKADAVISRAGAGVLVAHIHRKPAVLYAVAPFDHISPIVSPVLSFDAALAQALATGGVYAKYLYWFFQTQALRSDAPEFADRLLSTCETLGFGPAQLGLGVQSGFAKSLADTHDAAQALTLFLSAQPEITEVELTERLKVSDQSWVFTAQINGDKVVVKRFLNTDAAHTVRSLQGELGFIENVFENSAFGVNRCLFAWPEAATVVLSYAGDLRMVGAIAAQSGAARATLLTKAGAWLNAYATPRHRQTSFGPRHWVKELDARARHKLTQEDHAVFDAGLSKLSQLAQQTMGCLVTQGATHGDYAGINVHLDGDRVIGVDIQGECWQAIAKDAAQFLVWQALFDPRDTGARICGIDGADFEAFLSGLPMLEAEQATTMPFFIGWKIMHRVLDKADRGADTLPEISLLQAYLDDLDGHLET